jgi:hypothetical protein
MKRSDAFDLFPGLLVAFAIALLAPIAVKADTDTPVEAPKESIEARIHRDQEKRHEATKRFVACVNAAIAKLDDHVSPADVIAIGAIAACRAILDISEFKDLMSDPGVLDASLKPNIIAKILEQRAKNRAPEAQPQQPKSPPTM